MNRRGFLKALGCLAAVPVAAKFIPNALVAPDPEVVQQAYTTYLVGKEAIIGEYADYMSFSDVALSTALDPATEKLVEELSYRCAITLSSICPDSTIGSRIRVAS